MNKNNRNNEQIYGRNDMIMLDQNNKIYGSLGLADRYVMKTEEGTKLILSNPKLGSFDDVLTELNIYGWSKQETTKGKNLFDFSRLVSDGVNAIDYEKQTITVPAKTNNTGYNQTLRDLCPGITPGTYVFSAKRSNPESGNGSYFLEAGLDFTFNAPIELTDALLDNHIAWYNNMDSEVENVISEIQIEIGTEATDYEPYTGGQPSPSPDYPQQIVSAGNSGNIEVNVRGKNLVDVYGYSANDIPNPEAERVLFNIYGTTLSTTEKTDKLIVHQEIIDGATVNNHTSGYFCIGINRKLEANKDYIITFRINVIRNPFSASNVKVSFNGIEFENGKIIGDKVTVKAKYTEYRERQYVEVRNSGMSLEISDFMITEVGETDDYEPYQEEQTVTLPYTLNAIPVSSGGNYTDQSGQQWICDEVDLHRGVKVQRVYKVDVDGENIKFVQSDRYAKISARGLPTALVDNGQRIYGISTFTSLSWFFNAVSGQFLYLIEPDISDKINESCKKQIGKIYYALETPIETPLTSDEIAAYKALSTKAPTTIIENNYDTWMKATYKSTESV